MRTIKILLPLALLAFSQGGCVLTPEIKEKIIQLAIGGAVSDTLDAGGSLNVHDDRDTIDVRAGLDLAKLLDDAGVDVADVKDIKVSGISYRTVVFDTEPTRTIVNGNVTAERIGVTGEVPIITSFTQIVNDAVSFQTAPVSAGGITILNDLLTDLLEEVRIGFPASNTKIAYHVTGNSTPTGIPTAFQWELKVQVSIVGEVKVDVVE